MQQQRGQVADADGTFAVPGAGTGAHASTDTHSSTNAGPGADAHARTAAGPGTGTDAAAIHTDHHRHSNQV